MSQGTHPIPSCAAKEAGAWTRALLTLDLVLEACRATPPDGPADPRLTPTLERMAPRGAPLPIWRACIALGTADLWQRIKSPRGDR